MPTSKRDIQKYINSILVCKNIQLIDGYEERKTRNILGITKQDQIDIVKRITINDYIKGPDADHDKSKGGFVWVFKRNEYGYIIYIKTKIITTNNMLIMSCHIDNII